MSESDANPGVEVEFSALEFNLDTCPECDGLMVSEKPLTSGSEVRCPDCGAEFEFITIYKSTDD